ncbi:MAG: AAA family ATPase [Gammaproteobacteria bacterium]|nr:AAA family ATPase [Gammaproteobacteria bacterium]
MLNKILSIKNIGNFENYILQSDAGGWNGEFTKLTLIYAGNGMGKTTLAGIFKSLATNNVDLLLGRKTWHARGNPEAALQFEDKTIRFQNGAWDHVYPGIEIFDSFFVSDNVYAAHLVSAEHKRKFHDFLIGEENIRLAESIAAQDTESKALSRAIREKEKHIKPHLQGNIDLNVFVYLQREESLEEKIKRQKQAIESIRQARGVADKAVPQPVSAPAIPLEEIRRLLAASMENISKDAEQRVKTHMAACCAGDNEKWLAEGFSHAKNGNCPFCGTNMSGMALLRAYQDYFNKGYQVFQNDIKRKTAELAEIFSENHLLKILNAISANQVLYEFWKQHISTVLANIDATSLKERWMAFAEQLNLALQQKQSAIPDALEASDSLIQCARDLNACFEQIAACNDTIQSCDKEISDLKNKVGNADLTEERQRLDILENTCVRYAYPVDEWCEEYIRLIEQKHRVDGKKAAGRNRHKHEIARFVEIFGNHINKYLADFSDDFRIVQPKTNYIGGKPNIDYKLAIKGNGMSLGSAKTPDSKAGFKNTLSDGDKSALAFAFFIAKLSLRPRELDNKTVIFDDPAVNLDNLRLQAVAKRIASLYEKTTAQVIVLTHDLSFASRVYAASQHQALTLQIRKDAGGAVIQAWHPAT